jgi:hypothetical protein
MRDENINVTTGIDSGSCTSDGDLLSSKFPSDVLLANLIDAISRRVNVLACNLDGSRGIDSNQSPPPPASAAPVGVLFSGGIDSVVLAAVLHLALEPYPELPIELINVTFEPPVQTADASPGGSDTSILPESTLCDEASSSKNFDNSGPCSNNNIKKKERKKNRSKASYEDEDADDQEDLDSPSPDRLAAIAALQELKDRFPSRTWRLLHVDVTAAERLEAESRIRSLILPNDSIMDLNIGSAFWFASRGWGYYKDYRYEA